MRLVTLLAALLLTGPAAASSGDAEAEVRATLLAMWAAIESGDLDAYAAHLHPAFSSFGENDVYLNEGKERELRAYRDYLKRASGVHTEMHQPKVTLRGDVAWITYYWTESAALEGQRITSRGKSTRIFVKEGRRWLCIHGHYTAVP